MDQICPFLIEFVQFLNNMLIKQSKMTAKMSKSIKKNEQKRLKIGQFN